ncbi:MAG: HAMP domain-containing histidine kinase [Bordetella sp.]|nr:HAMP domain-containing histidine kinase [Bordetella sp.]
MDPRPPDVPPSRRPAAPVIALACALSCALAGAAALTAALAAPRLAGGLIPIALALSLATSAALLQAWRRISDLADALADALTWADLKRRHDAEAQARDLHAQLNTVWRLNSLGEMAATLAHELNQPLSACGGYLHASRAEMEKAGPLGDSACFTLDLAQGQLLRAGEIIRRIRGFLAQETGVLGHERASAMVESIKPILTHMGQDRGVAIRIEMDGDDDGVQADRIQFQQAVVNLVRNGVEAAEGRDGAEVRVLGGAEAEGYRVSVEDNGPGVPDDQIDRLFQPMTSAKPGGMGLGLSVTRTIVERHGGVLGVGRSPALGGAAFSFTLPLDPEAKAA